MARCLIIGCGCRGRSLARELTAAGVAVRGTTRSDAGRAEISRAGAEPFVGDPDRVATLARALEQVTVACLLLGSATGSAEQLAALHSTRLEMLLSRMLDSTVRAIVYEAAGTASSSLLLEGAGRVRAVCDDSRIPYAILGADPSQRESWLKEATAAVTGFLH